ncbi:MAG: 50S ribosomal protein L25 [Lentisphaeria bacterium]|nr:50S ribosomal protein L25 [Lentisphaeria bacterium]
MSASETVIKVVERAETGKGAGRRLRAEGKVPAVIYGHGKAAVNLSVAETEIIPVLHHTGLVKLEVEGKKTAKTAVIKDYQMNTLKARLVHVDFLEVKANEVISTMVDVVPHGTPAGAAHGGVLDQILYSVEVRGAANKLPESVIVELDQMEIGDVITCSGLALPDGVDIVGDTDQIIFSLHLPKIEAAAEDEDAEAGAGDVKDVAEEAAAE